MRHNIVQRNLLFLSLLVLVTGLARASSNPDYRVDWTINLEANNPWTQVTLQLADGHPVRAVRFDYDPARFKDFNGEGLDDNGSGIVWRPERRDATLQWRALITRERQNKNQDKSYDALMTADWALFRGDRVIPGMSVTTRGSAAAEAWLSFKLPKGWGANTGWVVDTVSNRRHSYRVDDPDRRFDRPTGWMIAGQISNRRDRFPGTFFMVSTPRGSVADRGGWLSLASLVWPQFEEAFKILPPKILVVSGDDPLWRGGLSGPNSLFFHSSRMAVSDNGTSPLLHELTHVVTRISGGHRDDWIAEGIAEYYGIELMFRAGGMSERRKSETLERLAKWGREAKHLRGESASGPVTARAVTVFDELDKEIRSLTKDRHNLDDLVRLLMEKRKVNLPTLKAAFARVTKADSMVLETIR